MTRALLIQEATFRLAGRGTKELTLWLQKTFTSEIEQKFQSWQDDDIAQLVFFLKQDEQWLADFFLLPLDKKILSLQQLAIKSRLLQKKLTAP